MHLFVGLVALWLSGPSAVGRRCLDADVANEAVVTIRSLVGDRTAVCFGDAYSDSSDPRRACAVVDRHGRFTQTIDASLVARLPERGPAFTTSFDDGQLAVCERASELCASVTQRYPPGHQVAAIGVSDDGHRVAVMDGAPRADGGVDLDAEIIAMPSGRRLSRFRWGETFEVAGEHFRLTAMWHADALMIGFIPAAPTMWHLVDPRDGRRTDLMSGEDSIGWFGTIGVIASGRHVAFVDPHTLRSRSAELPGKHLPEGQDASTSAVMTIGGRAMIAMTSPPAIVPVDVERARLGTPRRIPLCAAN